MSDAIAQFILLVAGELLMWSFVAFWSIGITSTIVLIAMSFIDS